MVNSPINTVHKNHPAVRYALDMLRLSHEGKGEFNCTDIRGNRFYAPTEEDINGEIARITAENLAHLQLVEEYALPGRLVLTGREREYILSLEMHGEKVTRGINRNHVDSSKNPVAEVKHVIDQLKKDVQKRIDSKEKKRLDELEALRVAREKAAAAERKKRMQPIMCPDHAEPMLFSKKSREFRCTVPDCRKVARPFDKPSEDAAPQDAPPDEVVLTIDEIADDPFRNFSSNLEKNLSEGKIDLTGAIFDR